MRITPFLMAGAIALGTTTLFATTQSYYDKGYNFTTLKTFDFKEQPRISRDPIADNRIWGDQIRSAYSSAPSSSWLRVQADRSRRLPARVLRRSQGAIRRAGDGLRIPRLLGSAPVLVGAGAGLMVSTSGESPRPIRRSSSTSSTPRRISLSGADSIRTSSTSRIPRKISKMPLTMFQNGFYKDARLKQLI
jgi:hypothetical protein